MATKPDTPDRGGDFFWFNDGDDGYFVNITLIEAIEVKNNGSVSLDMSSGQSISVDETAQEVADILGIPGGGHF